MKLRFVFQFPFWRSLRRLAVAALWVVGGGALVGVAFVASFFLAMSMEMRSTQVQVPGLAGTTLEEARELAAPAELVVQVVEQRHDPRVASGRVLEQTPRAGASVRRGRKVKLIMSLGGEVLHVPDLVGHAARAVQIELQQAGFALGAEARIPSAGVPTGRVVAQVPPAGTAAVPRARVHCLVSDGPPARVWVMPDLSGIPRRAAERWLTASGFRVGAVRRITAPAQSRDTVVGQLPLAGYPIRTKAIVDLAIAD